MEANRGVRVAKRDVDVRGRRRLVKNFKEKKTKFWTEVKRVGKRNSVKRVNVKVRL